MNFLIFSFLAIGLIGIGYWLFKKFGWLDNPQKYGFEREAVPYGFGLVLFIAFVFGLFWFVGFELQKQLFWFLIASTVLVGMSFLDDQFAIPPSIRFIVQILCAMMVVFLGNVKVTQVSLPFDLGLLDLGLLSSFIGVFWIVLVTNLMNFLDGVSGLSSAVSLNGFVFLVALSLLPAVHALDQNLVVLIGSLMAFLAGVSLFLEFDSPKVLVGDSGVMWFGFSLAVLSMINGGKLATLGLVLIVPILDGLMLILFRLLNLKKPWEGDLNHLHHLLLRHGWSRRKIVVMYFIFSAVLGVVAILFWNSVIKFIVMGLSILGLLSVILLSQKKYGQWKIDA